MEMSRVRHTLDIVTSRVSRLGEDIGGTSKDFINFATSNLNTKDSYLSSPNNDNVNFDPRAKVILISGKTQDEINSQSVRLINRPYDSFSYKSEFYRNNESKFRSIISGNLVRYVYNAGTGETTFYYYESIENRWIISTQKTDPKQFDFGSVKFGRKSKYVFEWIQDPVMSKLR